MSNEIWTDGMKGPCGMCRWKVGKICTVPEQMVPVRNPGDDCNMAKQLPGGRMMFAYAERSGGNRLSIWKHKQPEG